MAISKVILNGVTQIDLTSDTTDATKTLLNYTGHDAAGESFVGSIVDGDYVRTVICDTQTFTVPSGQNYYIPLNNTERLVDGDEYIVTFDNVEYICTCTELWGSDRFVGDLVLTWGTLNNDYIFPFCLEDWNSNTNIAIYARDKQQHTVKIEHLERLTTGTTLVPKTITTNGTYNPASDNADGYSSLSVNVPNVDCPVFSGVYDDNVGRINSCSMTYSECSALAQSGKMYAFLDMTVGTQVQRAPMICNSIGSALRYDCNQSAGFSFSVTYNSNGTITYAEPSAMTTLFTVSQSGNNQTDSAGRLIGAVSVPAGTAGTPTATKGTVSNHSVTVTPSVTNTIGWITGSTKTGTAVSVTASELVSGTYTVNSSGTHDVTNYASASVASGTATASASKGTVSNHSVTVTPSVTRTAGYITAGSASGTAVTVSASELVSGSQTITQNGTVDVTNLASVTVDVQGGGGGGGMQIETATTTPSSTSTSITFTGLRGEPTSFVVTSAADLATGTPAKTAAVVFDGTSLHGQTVTNTSNAQASYDGTNFSKTYSNGTLTITGTSYWQANQYKLVYTYGGNASNIGTDDVQVGSGATSITFTGLEDEPDYFSVIFKSNFSTSSGYQRVMAVAYDGTSTYGLAMDSGEKALTSWSYTYNNGSLTVSSVGTNNGGYFHQPGYYQLTYGVGGEASPYQKINKTYTPTTSTQTEKIEPSTGYDAISEVNVTVNPIPSQYIIPTGNYAITQNGNNINIAQYATVSVNVPSSGGANIATATMTNSSNQNTSISFTLPSGRTPKAFFARLTSQIARSSNSRYYYVFDMRWDGSSTGGVAGNTFYMYSGTLTNVTSGYSYEQSGTTFTLSSTGSRSASPGSFYNGTYELVYVY